MEKIVKVALDAMGGDNAPAEPVKGAVEAVNLDSRLKIYICGKEPEIRAELEKYKYNTEAIEIVHCSEVIDPAEPPVKAVRTKKDSSMVRPAYSPWLTDTISASSAISKIACIARLAS